MKNGKERIAATLTFYDADQMTQKGARAVVAWLKKQADHMLDKDNREAVAPRFTARYWYKDEPIKKPKRKRRAGK